MPYSTFDGPKRSLLDTAGLWILFRIGANTLDEVLALARWEAVVVLSSPHTSCSSLEIDGCII